jgi:hypothetical protein
VIKKKIREPDTIVVPVQKDGFDRIILGENAWWAVRISAGMLPKIKHIAVYQRSPMWRQSHKSNLMGGGRKFKLVFSEPAKPVSPIPFADAPSGSMQRETPIYKIQNAKKLADLFEEGT